MYLNLIDKWNAKTDIVDAFQSGFIVMSHAVTANRLRDGRVVFRTVSGGWSLDVAESAIEPSEAAANAVVAEVNANANAQDVVEVYAVEMNVSGRSPRPARLREAIRAMGPTIAYLPVAELEAAE
jgi:Protein of unknown function (DUF2849)